MQLQQRLRYSRQQNPSALTSRVSVGSPVPLMSSTVYSSVSPVTIAGRNLRSPFRMPAFPSSPVSSSTSTGSEEDQSAQVSNTVVYQERPQSWSVFDTASGITNANAPFNRTGTKWNLRSLATRPDYRN